MNTKKNSLKSCPAFAGEKKLSWSNFKSLKYLCCFRIRATLANIKRSFYAAINLEFLLNLFSFNLLQKKLNNSKRLLRFSYSSKNHFLLQKNTELYRSMECSSMVSVTAFGPGDPGSNQIKSKIECQELYKHVVLQQVP